MVLLFSVALWRGGHDPPSLSGLDAIFVIPISVLIYLSVSSSIVNHSSYSKFPLGVDVVN